MENRSICRRAAARGGGWHTVVEICNTLRGAAARRRCAAGSGVQDACWIGRGRRFPSSTPVSTGRGCWKRKGRARPRKREGVAPPGGAGRQQPGREGPEQHPHLHWICGRGRRPGNHGLIAQVESVLLPQGLSRAQCDAHVKHTVTETGEQFASGTDVPVGEQDRYRAEGVVYRRCSDKAQPCICTCGCGIHPSWKRAELLSSSILMHTHTAAALHHQRPQPYRLRRRAGHWPPVAFRQV